MKILNKLFLFLVLFNLLAICLYSSSSIYALNIPKPKARVNDYADMLTAQEEAMLEKRLEEYDKSTSNQIAVLTIKSLEGEALEDFSIKVAQSWGIGQKGKDNGVLILISKAEHKIRIEVGYGLEGVIPDGVAGRIIREEMAPNFRQDKVYTGINSAIDKIVLAVKGEYKSESSNDSDAEVKIGMYLILLVVIMFIASMCGFAHFLLGGVIGGIGTFFLTKGMFHSGIVVLFFATIAGILVGMAARFIFEALVSGGGDTYSFGGLSSSSGGSGFGGFGGGGFGGGGASGGW